MRKVKKLIVLIHAFLKWELFSSNEGITWTEFKKSFQKEFCETNASN